MMSAGANVKRILDLSTANAPSNDPEFGDIRWENHQYGWVVFVPDRQPEGVADWLKPILEEAIRLDCMLILFDRDGPVCDAFPTYEWEKEFPNPKAKNEA